LAPNYIMAWDCSSSFVDVATNAGRNNPINNWGMFLMKWEIKR
jgi:hypothetical protein